MPVIEAGLWGGGETRNVGRENGTMVKKLVLEHCIPEM